MIHQAIIHSDIEPDRHRDDRQTLTDRLVNIQIAPI